MIHLTTSRGGDSIWVDTPLARCEIALLGAQVLSYLPKAHGRDLLWCSDGPLAPHQPPHGGIPLCWPWFAKQDRPPEAVQHGFARLRGWRLQASSESPEGEAELLLTLNPKASDLRADDWPPDCEPSVRVRIGTSLEIRLRTENRSTQTLSLTQALHTYLRVGDVRAVRVEGLQGLRYLDKLRDFEAYVQNEPWRFETACDRIYQGSGPLHRLDDPVLGRSLVLASTGSASTVVWNPGAVGVEALQDVAPADWPGFLCIETANCAPADRVSLPPGASTELRLQLFAQPSHPPA